MSRNQTFPGTALSFNRPSSRKPYPFLFSPCFLLTFVQEKGVILSVPRLKPLFHPGKSPFPVRPQAKSEMNTQPFRAARGRHPATRRRQMVGRITSIVLPDKNGVKREPNILEKSDLLTWLQVRATTGRGGGPTPEPPAPRPCCSRRASLPRGGGAPGLFPGQPLASESRQGQEPAILLPVYAISYCRERKTAFLLLESCPKAMGKGIGKQRGGTEAT